MSSPTEQKAEKRAFGDFKEKFPGQRFDKSNSKHVDFMRIQTKVHLDLLQLAEQRKEFTGGL